MRLRCLLSFFVFASFIALLVECGGEDGSTGATAPLSWDPGQYDSGITFTVHYSTNSSGDFESCDYEHAVDEAFRPPRFLLGCAPVAELSKFCRVFHSSAS